MSTATAPATSRRQPELMGLRAVLIGFVITKHWTLVAFPFGELGRLPLFVLSGYLISGIIWKTEIYWAGGRARLRRLGVFYTRRFLRIIPPYYASLALGALLPLAALHQYPGWFVLPLANVLCYRLGHWPEGVGHYWTLAVEEQFYFIWPLLLGLFRRRAGGLWLLIGLSLAYRVYGAFYLMPAAPAQVTVLLPACLDLFAAGALLQLHTAAARRLPQPPPPYPGWPALATTAGWGLVWVFTHGLAFGEQLWEVVSPSLGALASYFMLRWLLHSPRQARWLAHPLALWLGKRSYGLYLYHLLLPVFYQRLVYHLLPASQASTATLRQLWLGPAPTLLLLWPVLIGLSAVSWHYLEAPLDRFRRRFAYT
jgi:peptidoglycan/LPS O-acetylase OafA/YrhL